MIGQTLGHYRIEPITNGKALDRNPAFSPDANLVYFLSERDGSRCIWAQRLAPRTKQPQRDALAVYTRTTRGVRRRTSATRRELAVSVGVSISSSAWMMEQQP